MTTLNIIKITPAAITGLTAVVGVNSVFLSWEGSAAASDKYEIYFSNSNDITTAALLSTVEANLFTHTNLSAGQYYYYWVRTLNEFGVRGPFTSFPEAATNWQLGSNFNTLKMYVYAQAPVANTWTVDTTQIQVWWTPSGGGTANSGLITVTTAITQRPMFDAALSSAWANPDNARVSGSGSASATGKLTNALVVSLSDAGVPADATVTGIAISPSASATTLSGGYIAQIGYESSGLVRVGTSGGNDNTVANAIQTITIGSSTELFNIDTPGTGLAVTPTVLDSDSLADNSGIASSTTTVTATSTLAAVSTFAIVDGGANTSTPWYEVGYLSFTPQANDVLTMSPMARLSFSAISSTTTSMGVYIRWRLYDETLAANVNGYMSTQQLYFRNSLGETWTSSGSVNPQLNFNPTYVCGFRGISPGHSYKLICEVQKYYGGDGAITVTPIAFGLIGYTVGTMG